MPNASSLSFSLSLLPTDVSKIANHFATLLHRLASGSNPSSSSLLRSLRAVHAQVLASGFRPRSHILNRFIHLYANSGDLLSARHLFSSSPVPLDAFARTSLVSAYSAAGRLDLARQLFDETPYPFRDTVFYNAMISACSRACDGPDAVALFSDMLRNSFRPDNYTFTAVFSAAAAMVELKLMLCQQLHCAVEKSGTERMVSVLNALITVYMKCESPEAEISAREVFNRMHERDELTWTTMVVGYVRRGLVNEARLVFESMGSTFDVVWNAMISGYVHAGLFLEAFELFRKMVLQGIPLDEFTYTSVLSACANTGLFVHGKAVHAHIIRAGPKFGAESALPVKNVLVTLYSKCGKVDVAQRIFDEIGLRDSVSWNAILSGYVNAGHVDVANKIFKDMPQKNQLAWMVMISGFVHNGHAEEALKLFNRMRAQGLKPCDYTCAGAIAACGELGALWHGRQLHAQLVRFGYESSNSAGNALLTMYAKCGAVEAAHLVFLVMPNVDSVSWNAMIAAFGQHGHGIEAIELFDQMIEEGIYPDRITFLTVLSACNHAGLVDEGFQYFESMERDFGIKPGEDHYIRLIDLLGRSGRIREAKDVINSMPFEPTSSIWEAVLAGCRIHTDMDIGIQAAEKLLKMIPQHDGTYILLSNIYSAVGRWEDAAIVRKLMRDRGVKKEPGCSWIEVENKVHVFLVHDTMHPEMREVHRFLEALGAKMRKLGYVPVTKFVLHDMEPQQKEHALSTHSEKLAVGFGLLKLPPGATIRVLKNLRICGDCHSAIMFMTKAVGREIVVRDVKRFHHFKDGECSCGNYW